MTEEERSAYEAAFDGENTGAQGQSGDTPTGITLGGDPAGQGGADGSAAADDTQKLTGSPDDSGQQAPSGKELQAWEDRLKAREAELKAAEAKLAQMAASARQPQQQGTQPRTLANGGTVEGDDEQQQAKVGISDNEEFEAIKADAQALAEDPKKFKEAIDSMVQDYGREFVVGLVALLSPVVDAKASIYVKQMDGSLEGLVKEVVDAFASMHRDRIQDAHEDFEEVVGSPEFEKWISTLPPEEKSATETTLNAGSAGRIVKVLQRFKDSIKPPEPEKAVEVEISPEEAMRRTWDEDAATSVRSTSPVRIPAPRAKQSPEDEYASAFDKA